MNWQKLIIKQSASIYDAMLHINEIAFGNNLLFVVDEQQKLIGTLTDGDIRRSLLQKVQTTESVVKATNTNCMRIQKGIMPSAEFQSNCRVNQIELLPIVDESGVLVDVVSFAIYFNRIPVQAIIMAGGRGERLKPLTDVVPKPLLEVGGKPIIEHNIDRLVNAGVEHIAISVNYLGHMLKDYFGNGHAKGIEIDYIDEDKPMGTLGAVSNYSNWRLDDVLIMNSDLLTNINFADFFQSYKGSNADIAIASVPYKVDLPYAVLEIESDCVKSLAEKPTYTYYANAGIYLVKRHYLQALQKEVFYNATDLIEKVIAENGKVISYPILTYWLDIGKKNDFDKAQEDIKHITL